MVWIRVSFTEGVFSRLTAKKPPREINFASGGDEGRRSYTERLQHSVCSIRQYLSLTRIQSPTLYLYPRIVECALTPVSYLSFYLADTPLPLTFR